MRIAIALVFVFACGGKGESKPPEPTPPTPPPAPTLPVTVADGYTLPPAPHRTALPAKPATYVFVTRAGEVRRGPTPVFADAVPDKKPDVTGGGDDPNGFGFGPAGSDSPGAMPVVSRALAFAGEAPPADARFVLVADASAPFAAVAGVLASINESTAIAVDAGDGTSAALAVAIDAHSQPTFGGGVELAESKRWSELVTLLDGAAAATPGKPIGITLLFDKGTYGSLGWGPTPGSGFGVGSDGNHHAPDVPRPHIAIGAPTTTGDLDPAIIRRYIKRNIAKITYCYEKQLIADEKLAGAVEATFTISPQGTVSAAAATGVHVEVSACIAAVIRGIEFPKPKGGGAVEVTYPFTFAPPPT